MNRNTFKKSFKCVGPAILPVIHVLDNQQVETNLRVVIGEGAQGVFLINHDFDVDTFLPIIRHARKMFPELWLGVNFLAVDGSKAFPILADLQNEGIYVDAYWADDACIDEHTDEQVKAKEIDRIRGECGWQGLYFGGTAFKKQRPVAPEHHATSATIAARHMDVVTTSGVATGQEAGQAKIESFRSGLGDTALAIASGVTPDNVANYARDVDAILVATGINHDEDFYNIDRHRLRQLLQNSRIAALSDTNSGQSDRDNRWYLSLMAPRSRGEKYAWLDPSSAYINGASFNAMVDDLLEPFGPGDIDLVAGFDAAGFVLGGAMAIRLGKGFLTIRKGGKIPVAFDSVPMNNYSGQTQSMEMRKPAFAPGTRVLLVDQWIETGGTMTAGIQLVERQQGIVAGIAAVCIEENPATDAMKARYTTSSCVLPGTVAQEQCNNQMIESFKTFKPEDYFPSIGKSRK